MKRLIIIIGILSLLVTGATAFAEAPTVTVEQGGSIEAVEKGCVLQAETGNAQAYFSVSPLVEKGFYAEVLPELNEKTLKYDPYFDIVLDSGTHAYILRYCYRLSEGGIKPCVLFIRTEKDDPLPEYSSLPAMCSLEEGAFSVKATFTQEGLNVTVAQGEQSKSFAVAGESAAQYVMGLAVSSNGNTDKTDRVSIFSLSLNQGLLPEESDDSQQKTDDSGETVIQLQKQDKGYTLPIIMGGCVVLCLTVLLIMRKRGK